MFRGRDGRDGLPGPPGPAGPPGPPGTPGIAAIDLHYPQPPTTDTPTASPTTPPTTPMVYGGLTYIRWGRTSCPTVDGTEYVYDGITAGSWYHHTGGGSNYICLVKDPKYPPQATTYGNYIYGTEYHVGGQVLSRINNHNAPCAACHVTTRSAQLMIPGTDQCPGGWTTEYKGWLMSGHYSHKGRSMFVCVDKDAQALPGTQTNTAGALMYHTSAECTTGIPCRPYVSGKTLACVVCTK